MLMLSFWLAWRVELWYPCLTLIDPRQCIPAYGLLRRVDHLYIVLYVLTSFVYASLLFFDCDAFGYHDIS